MANYKLVILARPVLKKGSPTGHMSIAIFQEHTCFGFWGFYSDGTVKKEPISDLRYYTKAAYKEISAAQLSKIRMWIKRFTDSKGKNRLYYWGTNFNCTHFARDMCRIAGVDTPHTNLWFPQFLIEAYIKHGWKPIKFR